MALLLDCAPRPSGSTEVPPLVVPSTAWDGCENPSIEEVATGDILDAAVDGEQVYWIDGADVMARSGRDPATVLTHLDRRPRSLAIDDTHVYVALERDDNEEVDKPWLVRVPRGGGPSQVLLRGEDNFPYRGPRGLAVADGRIVFNDDQGTIQTMPTDGSRPPRLLWVSNSHPVFAFSPQRSLALHGNWMSFLHDVRPPPYGGEAATAHLPDGVIFSPFPGPRPELDDRRLEALTAEGLHVYMQETGTFVQPGHRLWRCTYLPGGPCAQLDVLDDVSSANELRASGEQIYAIDGERVRQLIPGPARVLGCGPEVEGLQVRNGGLVWIEQRRRIRWLAVEAPPTPAPSTPPTPPPGPWSTRTLHVRAQIDQTSQLVLQGTRLHWHHFFRLPPSYSNDGTIVPVEVNDQPWPPDFENRAPNSIFDNPCNCDSDDLVIDAALAPIEQTLSLEVTDGRGRVFVSEPPTAANQYTAQITFDDGAYNGQAIYDVTLTYLSPP